MAKVVQKKKAPAARRGRRDPLPAPAKQQLLEAIWLEMDRVIAEWAKYKSAKKRRDALEKTLKWVGATKGAAGRIERRAKALMRRKVDAKRAFREAASEEIAAAMARMAASGTLVKFLQAMEADRAKSAKGKSTKGKSKGVRGVGDLDEGINLEVAEGSYYGMPLAPSLYDFGTLGLGTVRDGVEGLGIYGLRGDWYGRVEGAAGLGFIGDILGSAGRLIKAVVKPISTVAEGLGDILNGDITKGFKKIMQGALRDGVLGSVAAVMDLMKAVTCNPLVKTALGVATMVGGAAYLGAAVAGGTAAAGTMAVTAGASATASIAGASVMAGGLTSAGAIGGAMIGYKAGKAVGGLACSLFGALDKGTQKMMKATGGDYRGKKSKAQLLQERVDMYEQMGEPYVMEQQRLANLNTLMAQPERLAQEIGTRTYEQATKSRTMLFVGLGVAGLAAVGLLMMSKKKGKKRKTQVQVTVAPPAPGATDMLLAGAK